MSRDQKPNWEKWRHVPDVNLWEGVSLSLGMEPEPVHTSPISWYGEELVFKDPKELNERLFVAARNLTSGGSLEPTSIVMGDPARSMVRLRQFAAWVLSLGWPVPPEFAALAPHPRAEGAADTSGPEKPLEGKGRASALKLILGMAIGGYGYDPKATRSPIPKEIADDLLLSGITLTDDTVREWLRVAAQEVEWQPRGE